MRFKWLYKSFLIGSVEMWNGLSDLLTSGKSMPSRRLSCFWLVVVMMSKYLTLMGLTDSKRTAWGNRQVLIIPCIRVRTFEATFEECFKAIKKHLLWINMCCLYGNMYCLYVSHTHTQTQPSWCGACTSLTVSSGLSSEIIARKCLCFVSEAPPTSWVSETGKGVASSCGPSLAPSSTKSTAPLTKAKLSLWSERKVSDNRIIHVLLIAPLTLTTSIHFKNDDVHFIHL